MKIHFVWGILYGRAGRLNTKNAGFRSGQYPPHPGKSWFGARYYGCASRGPQSHYVPISIYMCSKTAIIVCIFERVEIQIGT